jgi:hypothetical protein
MTEKMKIQASIKKDTHFSKCEKNKMKQIPFSPEGAPSPEQSVVTSPTTADFSRASHKLNKIMVPQHHITDSE